MEHIHGHLWHRYSITINQVAMAKIDNFLTFWYGVEQIFHTKQINIKWQTVILTFKFCIKRILGCAIYEWWC
jgi:nucleosome binding factor SPN SPT16 subunit